jgi:hypothetical protein
MNGCLHLQESEKRAILWLGETAMGDHQLPVILVDADIHGSESGARGSQSFEEDGFKSSTEPTC